MPLIRSRVFAIAAAILLTSVTHAAQSLGSAFTYQGELRNAGQVANGLHKFRFRLYDAAYGGTQVGDTLEQTLTVSSGRFGTRLDFGADAFNGDRRYLDIEVSPAAANAYEVLTPRQEVTGTPYTIARRMRSIVVTGNAMFHNPSDAQTTATAYGPRLSATAQPIGFSIPRPADWDMTQPFTVTLYFAVPSLSTSSIVNWQLRASSQNLNLDVGSADSGWDSLDFSSRENGTPLNIYAAPNRVNMMKSQTWTAHWSQTYSTWYFGNAVSTNNSFSADPMWTFAFQRGSAVPGGNGEGYTQSLIVVSAEVRYPTH